MHLQYAKPLLLPEKMNNIIEAMLVLTIVPFHMMPTNKKKK
jgi:hypothetical protein